MELGESILYTKDHYYHFNYILHCCDINNNWGYYVGETKNIINRLNEHKQRWNFFQLIYLEVNRMFFNYLKREQEIINMNIETKEQLILDNMSIKYNINYINKINKLIGIPLIEENWKKDNVNYITFNRNINIYSLMSRKEIIDQETEISMKNLITEENINDNGIFCSDNKIYRLIKSFEDLKSLEDLKRNNNKIIIHKKAESRRVTIEIAESVREEIKGAKLIFRYRNTPDIIETYDQCIMRLKINSDFLRFLAKDKSFRKFMNRKIKTNKKYKAMKLHLYGNT